MSNKSFLPYIKEFDALRAVAVLGVMISHYLGSVKYIGILGSCGVTLFFVLSGYLITQILLKEKEKFQIDAATNFRSISAVLKTFYIRRSLRIFPIYYITLIVLVLLNIDSARQYWNYHFFYTSNFLYSFKIYFDHLSHFWSLAVEEQFYLIWPLLILFFPLRGNRSALFILLIIASIGFRFLMMYLYSANSLAIYFLMPSCMQSFAFGALVHTISKRVLSKAVLITLLILSFVIFIFMQIPPIHFSLMIGNVSKILSWTVFSFFCSIVILMIVKGMCKGLLKVVLNYGPIVYLGKISYGIYIYHMFVPGMLKYLQIHFHFDLSGSGINLLLHFLISFVIAHLSFILIERPINNLKSKFAY